MCSRKIATEILNEEENIKLTDEMTQRYREEFIMNRKK